MLFTKSYISSSSSNTTTSQDALGNSEQRALRQIGQGQCGTVYTVTGSSTVLKATNPRKQDQLANDYRVHVRVQDALRSTPLELRKDIDVPQVYNFIGPKSDLYWNNESQSLPQGFAPTYGIVSSRVYAVSLATREAIFDAFAPRSLRRNDFLNMGENKDCLLRLYLGRRAQRNPANAFKLRNFDLMVNEMEHLHLDTGHFARTMANSLAIMHWKAGVDANDVEFVLGSAPQTKPPPTADELDAATVEEMAGCLGQDIGSCHQHQPAGVWLLDFDQCMKFSETMEGLKQLERGFFFNDPYYPRPGSKDARDVDLWNKFKEAYLHTSSRLTESQMPEQFIVAVEREGQRRSAVDSLFD